MKLNSKGQLLIEMLVAIMVVAIIVIAVSNLFFVNMKEGKFTESRFDALMLAQEGMEAVKSISESSWHSIYLPPDGNGSKNNKGESFVYCLKNDASSWLLTDVASDCDITLNNKVYTRKIIIDNVNRDNGNISISSGSEDPSTQKIKIVISYADGKDAILEQYVTRWKNRIMKQDGWGSPAPADQAGCEALSGTWNAALSVCTAGLDNPANENGWDSYSDLDNGSGKLDTGAGSLKFK
ncbi:MAG: prepilin-type N-terminal cleavage/methylation domain-containing protein [Candidatus Paceibacterota bacterium]